MDKKEAIAFLKKSLTKIPQLAKSRYSNHTVILWRNSIEDVLEEVFGKDSHEYKRFYGTRAKKSPKLTKEQKQKRYVKQLRRRRTEILSIIQKYRILGIPEVSETDLEKPIITESPKAFIAHKGQTNALGKLKDFLDALGVQYLIAEVEPSDGRLVELQVTWTYKDADFAIILATKGGVVDKKKGVNYMAMNVADELGRAREIFKNRLILLLETGVEPHTNISGIVHERFTPQSMDKAFTKIARELRNWGFIRAGKAK